MRLLGKLAGVLLLVLGLFVAPQTSANALPPFVCGTVTGGSVGTHGYVSRVSVGTHPGYDRFVIQFIGPAVPGYTITPKSSAVFWLDPSNQRVVLRGTAGIKVVVHPAGGYFTYSGPKDVVTSFRQLLEARNIGDYEGYYSWGLGLAHQSCKRVFTLTAPPRLVIDVPN
jgi:hypothetical protein